MSSLKSAEPELCTVVSKDGGVLFDLERDRLLKLNSVAAEMWRQLSAGASQAQVVDRIAVHYSIDKQRVAADLAALLAKIAALGVPVTRPKILNLEDASTAAAPNLFRSEVTHRKIESEAPPGAWLILCSILGLAIFDLTLWATSLKSVCHVVRAWRLKGSLMNENENMVGRVCSAVEQACIWYPKKTFCLQRSAVTTCLLKNRGVPARLVIGARPLPFLAHAWVEVDASVVNDISTVKHFYQPLGSY